MTCRCIYLFRSLPSTNRRGAVRRRSPPDAERWQQLWGGAPGQHRASPPLTLT